MIRSACPSTLGQTENAKEPLLLIDIFQGVCRLESQGKSYQNHQKSGKSGKVRESQGIWKNCSTWSGKVRENFFVQIFNQS